MSEDLTPVDRENESARARAAHDATFGASRDGDATPSRTTHALGILGLFTGDIGPKSGAASRHRELSRRERSERGHVPPGSVAPGGARLVLLPLLSIAAGLLGIVVLLSWLSQ